MKCDLASKITTVINFYVTTATQLEAELVVEYFDCIVEGRQRNKKIIGGVNIKGECTKQVRVHKITIQNRYVGILHILQ